MILKGGEWDEVGLFKQPEGIHNTWLDFAFLYIVRLCQDLPVEFWTWGWRSCPKGLLCIKPKCPWTWMWKVLQFFFQSFHYLFWEGAALGLWRRQWQPIPVLLPGKSHGQGSLVGCSPWGHEESDMTEQLHFHALEKEMANHSSVLAWRIPGIGEPGGLLCMGSHRVGYDWSDLAAAAATHSSTLAWKIPWMEEAGRLQSMGSRRVRHDWATSLSLFTFMHGRRKWQPTSVFLPGESQGERSLVGCHLWGHTESDTTEAT